jgi:hypothetical protein
VAFADTPNDDVAGVAVEAVVLDDVEASVHI